MVSVKSRRWMLLGDICAECTGDGGDDEESDDDDDDGFIRGDSGAGEGMCARDGAEVDRGIELLMLPAPAPPSLRCRGAPLLVAGLPWPWPWPWLE